MTRQPLTVLLACAALSLGACGGSSGEGDKPEAERTAPSSAASPTATDGPACPGDVPAKVTTHLDVPAVTGVQVIGQCTTVVIDTVLGDDAGETAVGICDKAAEVAYEGDVNSVSVNSATGTELAVGILAGDDPAPCITDAL